MTCIDVEYYLRFANSVFNTHIFFHICRSFYPPGKVQLHHTVDIWFQIFTIHDKHVIEGCFIHHHLFDDTLQIVHFNFSYYDFNGAWNIDYAEWMKMQIEVVIQKLTITRKSGFSQIGVFRIKLHFHPIIHENLFARMRLHFHKYYLCVWYPTKLKNSMLRPA